MDDTRRSSPFTRRELFERAVPVATLSLVAVPLAKTLGAALTVEAQAVPLATVAGPDRIVMLAGKTYLNAWAGYGAPPRRGAPQGPGWPSSSRRSVRFCPRWVA